MLMSSLSFISSPLESVAEPSELRGLTRFFWQLENSLYCFDLFSWSFMRSTRLPVCPCPCAHTWSEMGESREEGVWLDLVDVGVVRRSLIVQPSFALFCAPFTSPSSSVLVHWTHRWQQLAEVEDSEIFFFSKSERMYLLRDSARRSEALLRRITVKGRRKVAIRRRYIFINFSVSVCSYFGKWCEESEKGSLAFDGSQCDCSQGQHTLTADPKESGTVVGRERWMRNDSL